MAKAPVDHPVGAKFEIEGAEYVATYSNGDCDSCPFQDGSVNHICQSLACMACQRTDHTAVFFMPLQNYLTMRLKGEV